MIFLPPPIGIPFVPFVGYGADEQPRKSATGWIVLLVSGWVLWQVVKDDVLAR